MKTLRLSIILATLMAVVAVGGIAARPTLKTDRATPRYKLEDIVPKQFGDWKVVQDQGVQVVNPQTQALLDSLYSQLLSRTYVNSKGYRIMLSLAYGDDQRGGLQAHKPEVCYPAQGFKLISNEFGALDTGYGSIPVHRLSTSMGARYEPITYWINVADTPVTNVLEKRIVEFKLGLTGQVPDGLLFRISSIDDTAPRAFGVHQAFIADLLKAVPPIDRKRLSGVGGPAVAG
jgi:EpsI family protein